MACFERVSPALREILTRIHRAERPLEVDHHVHEFGSVHYHVKHSVTDPVYTYLSVSTPLLSSQGLPISSQLLPQHTLEMVNGIFPGVMEALVPPNEGYQLTLKLDISRIPHDNNKASTKMISDIASVQSMLVSNQLKEILRSVDSQEVGHGIYKPIKLIYHPRESFFVIKQPAKMSAIFPMRFKEKEDVIIATAFFQELMDVGSTEAFRKAPHCIWSPIPPAELRGEPIEDLSTNGGFLSFDITARHVQGKKLEKTVWNLLNVYTFVKWHVKSSRGFVQRRMRMRLDKLVQPLRDVENEEDDDHQETRKKSKKKKKKKVDGGCTNVRKWIRVSKKKILERNEELGNKMKRIRSRIKIRCFSRLRRKWLRMPKFSPVTRYMKLE
ncbi:actin-related protein 2/3 complex subunit 2B [Salvia hispanica]|uniref:actin-related protein 2/3 complex subunit 2B n=1 Tax=Salvia hispanica TaxID=49212 RepID=UPI0020095491|nr:actin-related protein 2/3 complex subunit 2B [Salvia hispanica]